MRSFRSTFVCATLIVSVALLLTGCGGSGSGDVSTAAATAQTDPGAGSGSGSGTSMSHSPTISGTPAASATVGTAYAFQPNASDSPGNTLTFSATNLPSWATISATTGRVSGTPASGNVGTASNIVITVSDGTMTAALPAFSISIAAVIGTGMATISWTAPSQNTDGTTLTNLSGYQVVYGQSANNLSQSISIDDPTATSYTISNLTSGTWYFGVVATTPQSSSTMSTLASKTI